MNASSLNDYELDGIEHDPPLALTRLRRDSPTLAEAMRGHDDHTDPDS